MNARYKAWVCGRSLDRTAGSNPAGGMNICFYECCVLSGREISASGRHSSRGFLMSVVYRTVCDRQASEMRRPWPTRGCCVMENNKL